MSNNEILNKLTLREVIDDIIIRRDKQDLHDLIYATMGVNIPDVVVTEGSTSPMQFVADYMFGDVDLFVVLAGRGTGKTMCFGVLNALMAYYKPVEIATVGAIQKQSKKIYGYFKEFSSKRPFIDNIKSSSMEKTVCWNNAMIEVLVATMSGTNSPHPQLAFFDEIDLWKWSILQQAFSMAVSSDHVRARTALTSTRKFPKGPMQRMINKVQAIGSGYYSWNIWDVMEKLPVDDAEMMEKIYDTFGSDLPANIHLCNGFYKWKDLITKYTIQLDRDTWVTEYLCQKPGTAGIVYGTSFSKEDNVLHDWKPADYPDHGFVYSARDWGSSESHPGVGLACFVPFDYSKLIVFDERFMYSENLDSQYSTENEMLLEYGYVLGRGDVDEWGGKVIKGLAPDPAGNTEILEYQRRGVPVLPPKKKLVKGKYVKDVDAYRVRNGITMVKKLMEDRLLLIDARCVDTLDEVDNYSYKLNADGTYSDIVKKDKDHAMDGLRQLVILLYDYITNARKKKIQTAVELQKKRQKFNENPAKTDFSPNYSKPLTAGLSNKKF